MITQYPYAVRGATSNGEAYVEMDSQLNIQCWSYFKTFQHIAGTLLKKLLFRCAETVPHPDHRLLPSNETSNLTPGSSSIFPLLFPAVQRPVEQTRREMDKTALINSHLPCHHTCRTIERKKYFHLTHTSERILMLRGSNPFFDIFCMTPFITSFQFDC